MELEMKLKAFEIFAKIYEDNNAKWKFNSIKAWKFSKTNDFRLFS